MAHQPDLVEACRERARLKAETREAQRQRALRLRREEPELNKSQIAERLGVNHSTVATWLKGKP